DEDGSYVRSFRHRSCLGTQKKAAQTRVLPVPLAVGTCFRKAPKTRPNRDNDEPEARRGGVVLDQIRRRRKCVPIPSCGHFGAARPVPQPVREIPARYSDFASASKNSISIACRVRRAFMKPRSP